MKKAKGVKLEDVKEKQEEAPEAEQDYEAEGALRTLLEASKIRKNEKLMKRIAKIASDQRDEISSIADIKAAYNEKMKAEDEE